MYNCNDDIQRLMKKDSIMYQLSAFLLSAVFGLISGAAALDIRSVVVYAVRRAIYSAELEINQYSGFARMWEIGTIVALVTVWLSLVMVLWNRIDRVETMKEKLLRCGVWCAVAAAVFAVFRIIPALI